MTWFTTFDDEVTTGDVVALSLPGMQTDAIGLILGPGEDGRVSCQLGDHAVPQEARPRVEVEAYQLRMLVRRAEKGGDSK